jgi:hypothetical protein
MGDFEFDEEIQLMALGSAKPVVAYSQKTWAAGTQTPLHSENGFFRFPPGPAKQVFLFQQHLFLHASDHSDEVMADTYLTY